MGTLTQEALRQRIAAALEAVSGWTESRFHPGLFGMDTSELTRGKTVFAVEALSFESDPNDRQILSQGVLVYSDMRVRLSTPTTVTNPVSSADEALTREHTAIQTVVAIDLTDCQRPRLMSANRAPHASGEAVVSEISFRIAHQLALQ